MQFKHKNQGTCSAQVSFELDGNIIHNVRFLGGCAGNTQGVARLVEGMTVEEAESRLRGIRCGFKPTSCPDQLAIALREAYDSVKKQEQA